MKTPMLIDQIAQCLSHTDCTPQLLLNSKGGGAQLYTNYPCITGIPPESMAETFNQNAARKSIQIKAVPAGGFLQFTLSEAFLNKQLKRIAAQFRPAPPAFPDEDPAGYWCYVITALDESVPTPVSVAYRGGKEKDCLGILVLYLDARPESLQKRQTELAERISQKFRGRLFSTISEEERILLKAAAVLMARPQTPK